MTSLYRLYDADGTLLYVGITNKIIRRYSQHLATKPWIGSAVTARFELFATRAQAHEAEREAIRIERPLHNILRFDKPRRQRPNRNPRRSILIAVPSDLRAKLEEYVADETARIYPGKVTMTDVINAAIEEYILRRERQEAA